MVTCAASLVNTAVQVFNVEAGSPNKFEWSFVGFLSKFDSLGFVKATDYLAACDGKRTPFLQILASPSTDGGETSPQNSTLILLDAGTYLVCLCTSNIEACFTFNQTVGLLHMYPVSQQNFAVSANKLTQLDVSLTAIPSWLDRVMLIKYDY